MSWFTRVKDKLSGKSPASVPAAPTTPAAEPTTGLGFYQRGLERCKRGQHREAIADLDRALELRPRFAAALTERGVARELCGDFAGALRDCDAAIAADPSYPLAHANRINLLLRAKRWTDAVETGNLGLRLAPRMALMRYSRGVAHEMLGNLAQARDDYAIAIDHAPRNSDASIYAQQRLRDLPEPAHASPAPDRSWVRWRVLTGVAETDTLADVVRKVVAAHAFFLQLEVAGDEPAYLSIYGKYGLCRWLSELADVIGPAILDFTLAQLPMSPLAQPRPVVDADHKLVMEGEQLNVLRESDDVIWLVASAIRYEAVEAPVALFAQPPVFDRRVDNQFARRCAACAAALAYFDPVRGDDGRLTGIACPHCRASPVLDWIEARMRPGQWSRAGFLGEREALRDVIARDREALTPLAVTPSQIGEALDRLVSRAVDASRAQLIRAQQELIRELVRSGRPGFDGLARLPLGDTLDQLEQRLRDHQPVAAARGVVVEHYQIFLDVHQGHQVCPYTITRPPWSVDPPTPWMAQGSVEGQAYVMPPLELTLACSAEHGYRHANLEFLIVDTRTQAWLRGAGLHAHLIGVHGLFEGPASPFRLDPERAARVLQLAP
jgi:tetratricopeptide (TPR) repeat protein